MKLNTTIKTLCAAVALAASAAANAGLFYLDPLTDYTAVANDNCPTCTSTKISATLQYQSSTTITDGDFNGIDAGDLLTTSMGRTLVGGLSSNAIVSFDPLSGNNGYGVDNWIISFRGLNLQGMVTAVSDLNVPLLSYGPGLIQMDISKDGGASWNNFMDINLLGGTFVQGSGTVLTGLVDFTTVDSGFKNLFHLGDGRSCNGSTGYFDIWLNCGAGMPITFSTTLTTNLPTSSFTDNKDGTFSLTSTHAASAFFDVPEPASLALLGAGLLGLGAMRRRKSV